MLCEASVVAQGLENFMQGCSDHLPVGGPGAETLIAFAAFAVCVHLDNASAA